MGEIISIMFKTGVESKAEEVRAVSLATLMLLVESAGPKLLSNHCCQLTCALLESSSQLEPQMLSYLTTRATDENELQQLEHARVRVAGLSPVAQTVEKCIDMLPLESVGELMLRMVDLVKPNAGLLTRAATCQAIGQLVLRRLNSKVPPGLEDMALNRLFASLISACSDRSEAMRRNAAVTVAQLSRMKPDVLIPKAAKKACEWYKKASIELNEESDPMLAKASCVLFQALSQHCKTDVLHDEQNQAALAPTLFFALHEKFVTTDPVSEELKRVSNPEPDAWDDVWTELMSQGQEAVLRKQVESVCEILTSPAPQKYGIRLQMAIAIEQLVQKIVTTSLDNEKASKLLLSLVGLLQGRTWPGKQCIVECLKTSVNLILKQKLVEANDNDTFDCVSQCLQRESKKSQFAHSLASFKALASVMEENKSTKHQQGLTQVLEHNLERFNQSLSSSNDEQDETQVSKLQMLGFVAEWVDCINESKPCKLAITDCIDCSRLVHLFCLVMMRTTSTNSTRQLAGRLVAGFNSLFAIALANGKKLPMTEVQSATAECLQLSQKLTDARTIALAEHFLNCIWRLFEASSSKVELSEASHLELTQLRRFLRDKSDTGKVDIEIVSKFDKFLNEHKNGSAMEH